MRGLLLAGLAAVTIRFSSTWSQSLSDADGRPVPSRFATAQELFALASVTGEFEGTSLEFLPVVGQKGGFTEDIVELMVGMSVAAQRPLNWNILMVTAKGKADALAKLAVGDVARE